MNQHPADSVGIVVPRKIVIDRPLTLDGGKSLPRHELMVETYGTLNAARSNAILICHALSGDHHAAGYHAEDAPRTRGEEISSSLRHKRYRKSKEPAGGTAALVRASRLIPTDFSSWR